MKNGKLSVSLFPDSGHHFYFIPFAIGQGQGTPAAQKYSRDQDLPDLGPPITTSLSSLCMSGQDWAAAKKEGKEIVWLRGKFGTKRETPLPNQELLVFGFWCAIETNTGTANDGYTFDVKSRPNEIDPGLLAWKGEPGPTPFHSQHPSDFDYHNSEVINLDNVFELTKKIGGSVGSCILEIAWQVDGGESVPVSLIIDFGNTRTIAVGLERGQRIARGSLREVIKPILFRRGHDEGSPISQRPTMEELIPNSWIILREPTFAGEQFVPSQFTWPVYVTKSFTQGLFKKRTVERLIRIIRKVPFMFIEFAPAVLGLEAMDVLAEADISGGHLTFMSSPKRYSWDDQPVGEGGLSVWYMYPRGVLGRTRLLAGEMFRFLPRNTERRREIVYTDDPISPTEWEDVSTKPTATPSPPNFGRADALIWTALGIIERAAKQIQSEGWRWKSPVRRFLDNIVVTFPPGWTNEEVLAYWRAWFLAKKIYNWSHGGRPIEVSLDMRLDEAVASQLAIVFSEIRNYGDHADSWIKAYGRLRDNTACVRVLTIDIGGGTTDTALVEYSAPPTQSGVHLNTKVLFSDTTTHAGDRLIKDLVETVLLPTLGERFRSDVQRKQQFERFFSSSIGMREADDRLRRMVITRSVFMPLVYKWLEDISNNRAGNPNTDAKWEPIESGAILPQIDKLNAMFQDAGIADDSLLQVGQPFDVNYDKVKEVIRSWCDPLAKLHARYVEAFASDLVIVTGKPSELPIVQDLLKETLPLDGKRILFAKDYDAGDWFPGSTDGKIPDAKMVTVVGAALFKAIKAGIIPNWRIDEKIAQQVRNYWGVVRKAGQRLDASTVFLAREQDEITTVLPIGCVIVRARFLENEPENVYELRQRHTAGSEVGREIKVRIRRISEDSRGGTLRNERLELVDVDIASTHGDPITLEDIELHLCTLPFDEVHWLDQGRFKVRWE